MGIRFFCPNGHKLNVKEFQAGLRGVCPFCNAKFVIPAQSTRGKDAADAYPQAGAGGAAAVAAQSAVPLPTAWPGSPTGPMSSANDPFAAAPSASPQPLYNAPVQQAAAPITATAAPVAMQPIVQPVMQPLTQAVIQPIIQPVLQPVAQPVAPAHAVANDPLSEINVVWYIRPAAGGQFGPASSDVMRAWINEGRVSGDSLVWREGWRDWLPAADIFPQLQPGGPGIDLTGIVPAVATAAPGAPVLRSVAQNKSQSTLKLIITALVLTVVILLAIFIYVISRRGTEKPAEPDANAPTAVSIHRMSGESLAVWLS